MLRSLIIAVLIAACCAAAPSPIPSFSASGIDDVMDLHGDPRDARLVLFIGGNEWMAIPAIVKAFVRLHPDAAPVFYETLPPGILANQLAAGSLTVGSLVISVPGDVFMAGRRRMSAARGLHLVGVPTTYASNVLAIMVRAGNPKHVSSLRDLGRPGVIVAMPNPVYEGIARQIELALQRAGGTRLVDAVMVRKVRAGETLLTQIHHRQTPQWIEERRADAGPLWLTEARYQERIGAPVATISIPPSENVTATYQAAVTAHAAHAAAAREFVEFLGTSAAQKIFRSYGFGPPQALAKEE